MSNFEEKQKAIDKTQEICNAHFNESMKAINKMKKSNLKIDMLMGALNKQQECKNKVVDALQALQRLERDQRMAADLINQRYDQSQTNATLVLAAVMSASNQYDNILQTKAEKSLFKAIITDVVISFLPELKPLERFFGTIVKEKVKSQEMLDKLKNMYSKDLYDKTVKADYDYMNRTRDRLMQAGKLMDRVVIKDASRSAKNTISSNKYEDAASQLRDIIFQAKNEIFQQAISSIMSKLIHYNTVANFLYDIVPQFSDPIALDYVRSVTDHYGMGENIAPNTGLYNKLSDIILYSMLKRFAANYCSITEYETDIDKLDKWIGIDGLDKSQRQKIYDKFGSQVWESKPDYPAVNNSRDLLRYWDITIHKKKGWDPLRGNIIEKDLGIA